MRLSAWNRPSVSIDSPTLIRLGLTLLSPTAKDNKNPASLAETSSSDTKAFVERPTLGFLQCVQHQLTA